MSFETPKSETLSLFHLGERAYDHLIVLPTKSKGGFDLVALRSEVASY